MNTKQPMTCDLRVCDKRGLRMRKRATAADDSNPRANPKRPVLHGFAQIGLRVVREARGPVPLLTFAGRVLTRLPSSAPPVPAPCFVAALKRVIGQMRDEHLRVLSPTDSPGVGYVYDAKDPEMWPIRFSR